MYELSLRNLVVVVARSVSEVNHNAEITAAIPHLSQQHPRSEPQMRRHLTT